MATVTELVTEFKFAGSTAPLEKYNQSLGQSVKMLAGLAAGAAAAGAVVARWATTVLQAFDATEQLSRSTGESVEWLQEMGYVASVSGGSVEGFQQSVLDLSVKIGEAAQKGSDDFARLGISVRGVNGQVKSTQRIMDELRGRFQSGQFSRSEQAGFAEALGIDKSMLQTLNLTNREMSQLRETARDLGVLTSEQADQAVAYNDSLTTLRFGFDGLQRMIAVGLAPQLTQLAEWFTELLAANKDWIMEGVQAGMEAIGEFIKMAQRLAPLIGILTGAWVTYKLAVIAATVASAPLLAIPYLIAAAIAAVVLIVDDLIVAFQGGQSVIRDFFLEVLGFDIQPVLQAMVQGFQEAFGLILDITGGLITAMGGLFSGLTKLVTGDFEGAWEDIKNSFLIVAETMGNAFRALFGDIFKWIRQKVTDILPDWAVDLLEGGADLAGEAAEGARNMAASAGETIRGWAPDWMGMGSDVDESVRPGARGAGASQNNSRIEQTVNMEIRTSDPERAGRAAANNLQDQMDNAQYQAERGGM